MPAHRSAGSGASASRTSRAPNPRSMRRLPVREEGFQRLSVPAGDSTPPTQRSHSFTSPADQSHPRSRTNKRSHNPPTIMPGEPQIAHFAAGVGAWASQRCSSPHNANLGARFGVVCRFALRPFALGCPPSHGHRISRGICPRDRKPRSVGTPGADTRTQQGRSDSAAQALTTSCSRPHRAHGKPRRHDLRRPASLAALPHDRAGLNSAGRGG